MNARQEASLTMYRSIEKLADDYANIAELFRTTDAVRKGATMTAAATATFAGSGLGSCVTRTTTSAATGKYNIKPLPPGEYTTPTRASGFQDFTETPVKATTGVNSELDMEMVKT